MFDFENNVKDHKFEIIDVVRIPKYKKIFTKGYMPNWSEEVLVIKKVKILYCGDVQQQRKHWNILWKRIAKNKSKEFKVEKNKREGKW